jgi:hypothetical protein
MKRTLLFGALLFFLCASMPAGQGSEMTGKDLLKKMNSKEPCDDGYVRGYVMGVYGVYAAVPAPGEHGTEKAHSFSFTDEDEDKILKIAKKYLEGNPERLNQPANKLLTEAFQEAFPKTKRN